MTPELRAGILAFLGILLIYAIRRAVLPHLERRKARRHARPQR